MNLSKLLKNRSVVIGQTYEVPIHRYEAEYYEEHEDESEEEAADGGDEEQAAEERVSDAARRQAAALQKEREREQRERERARQEAQLKNLANQVLEEHSTQTQEKVAGLLSDEIVAQAHKTAELIVNHTLEATRFEMTNVIAQGYADGFAEGKNEALSVIEPALAKLAVFFESMASIQDLMLENFKDGMFSIISEISSKLIHRNISSGDEYLIELFNDAVKSIKVEEFVTVTVSESQVDFAVRNADLFKAAVSHVQDFKIVSDKEASRGTMIVETARTIADSSVYVQEEKIDEILAQMRDTLIIPQSAEEIEELEKIKSMRAENLDYLNLQDNLQDYENIEDIYDENLLENLENVSDIDNVG